MIIKLILFQGSWWDVNKTQDIVLDQFKALVVKTMINNVGENLTEGYLTIIGQSYSINNLEKITLDVSKTYQEKDNFEPIDKNLLEKALNFLLNTSILIKQKDNIEDKKFLDRNLSDLVIKIIQNIVKLQSEKDEKELEKPAN